MLALTICLIVTCLLIFCGCQTEQDQPMNLKPIVDAIAPMAVHVLVPEPWKTIAWVVLAAMGGGIVGKRMR